MVLFRYPTGTALTVSASLAQIGEFSFILAGLGVALKLLPPEGQSLILAGALISIATNPLMFKLVDPLRNLAIIRSMDPLAELPMTVDQAKLTGHVLLVGYGRVGGRIAQALQEKGVSFVVAEQNRELVERLRERGMLAVFGDASEAAVLIQGHVARARMLVIATPDVFQSRQMIEIARKLNPLIEIVVRTHTDDEAELMHREKVGRVFMGEHELALGMTHYVLSKSK